MTSTPGQQSCSTPIPTLSEDRRQDTLLETGIDLVRRFSPFVRSVQILGMAWIRKENVHNIATVIAESNV